jgi:hypothetical protein
MLNNFSNHIIIFYCFSLVELHFCECELGKCKKKKTEQAFYMKDDEQKTKDINK